jgi:DNA invertase Pin-like site-specific DNA recombinase
LDWLQSVVSQSGCRTDSIDTGTPSGRFFFHVMASLAEMERALPSSATW